MVMMREGGRKMRRTKRKGIKEKTRKRKKKTQLSENYEICGNYEECREWNSNYL
jgi:hypothetical protein